MKVVVLCGGISTERDVSLVSGSKIYRALKERGHKVVLLDIFLGYEGDITNIFDDFSEGDLGQICEKSPDLAAVRARRSDKSDVLFGPNVLEICRQSDIVFMGLHGDCGENGKVQATLDLFGIRYTGTDYLSSALAMDKWVSKQLFITNGIKVAPAVMLSGHDDAYRPEYPAVVKVCSGGSSIGVYIAHDEEEYRAAIDKAFTYEGKVIVEKYIKGREFTDGVFDGRPLPVVEIEPKQGFYDYKNKYLAGATVETCPAHIDERTTKAIQDIALKVYGILGIKVYARVDFIMGEDGEIYCLEANTLPGMTPTSLIPQEAAAEGASFPELCDRIIEVSLAKYVKGE